MKSVLKTLKGRSRVKRTMWSRRAQEYEAKINSGDPVSIAEVVRDLHRNADQPDQSYSERQIYQAALDRRSESRQAPGDQEEARAAADDRSQQERDQRKIQHAGGNREYLVGYRGKAGP